VTAAAHTCAAAQLEGCTGLLAQGGDASTAVLPVDAVCLPARLRSRPVSYCRAPLLRLRLQSPTSLFCAGFSCYRRSVRQTQGALATWQ
jgi:hypothetical protein